MMGQVKRDAEGQAACNVNANVFLVTGQRSLRLT